MFAIRSTQVILPGGVHKACIVSEAGRITAIRDFDDVPASASLFECDGNALLPGLVDTHIHINEPGRAEWEGFETATRAAAHGGYTTLVDMPLNSVPATTTVAALEAKRKAAQAKSFVDYAFWGGAVAENAADIPALAQAGVRGFKAFMTPSGVAEFSHVDEAALRKAMPLIAASGLPLLVHAEWPAALHEPAGPDYSAYLQSRPDEAEVIAIRLLIRLAHEFHCRVHIVHLATPAALNDLRAARAAGLPITVETCPHYLYFTAEAIPPGATQYKCAPPIRSAREALWRALREGLIDLVATDHSPCPPDLKHLESGDFRTAWGGIASISVVLPALFTKGASLSEIARWMSEKPAALAGLSDRKGAIAVGRDADFVVFNPDEQWTVTEDDLYFRHKISPYVGERLRGRVQATYLRGERAGDLPIGHDCTVRRR